MTVSIIRRRLLAAAGLVSVLSLAACGGGGSDAGTPVSWASTSGSDQVTTLQVTDTTVGTGATAASGNTVSVKYTVWLYDVRVATTHKGTQVDTGTFPLKLGTNGAIAGFEQGVTGMKVGGRRTVVVPASLAYGTAGQGAIPPSAALVFDLELLSST